MDEQKLVEACIRGDRSAQKALYQLYSSQVMASCLRYAPDRETAHDLFQEGFVKVFSRLESYNGTGALGAWIRRTVVNNALDFLRRQQRERNKSTVFEAEIRSEHAIFDGDDEAFADEPDEDAVSPERILELIQTMPTGYRTVFNLFVLEDYSHREIAEQLGISESTSKTQFKKAKSYLRKLIGAEKKILIDA